MATSSKRAGHVAIRAAALNLLTLLSGEISLTTLSSSDEGVVHLLNSLARTNSSKERLRLTRKLRSLKERGYLTKLGKRYVASRLANELLSEERIWSIKIPARKQWDGKWRMVLFDIPAKKEKQRRALRLRLKELGLELYQYSVWIYPYPLEREVVAVTDFYKISDYVMFAVAEQLSGQEHFKRLFKLH